MKKQSFQKALSLIGGFTGTLFSIAVLFRFLHFPGGTLLFGICSPIALILFSICACVYIKKYSALPKDVIIYELFAVIALIVLAVGIFFKTMHYPGGGYLLMISLIALAIVSICLGFALPKCVQEPKEKK